MPASLYLTEFAAKVVIGQGRGTALGFPSANLDRLDLAVAHGVYAVEALLDKQKYSGLMHFGPRKTFGGEISCEVFLKDFRANIYGRELKIKVRKKIRDIKKFDNTEDLKKQIKEDLKELGIRN